MEYYISKKMQTMKPSSIREFFKYAADPEVISLSAGSPCPEALPVEQIREIMRAVMDEDIEKALVYNISEGYPPLREALKAFVRDRYGSFTDDDDLLVLSGAQQCMDLSCKILCDEGDVVICEDPSFTGSVNAFRSYGVQLVGIPMEEDGIDMEALEKALQENKKVRFIYLIPNFQNPTGYTMSLAKRRRCYELAKTYGVHILEDDPYGDLRFEGENLPSIKSMDTEGIVLYAKTFSKILSAGIRVGYLTLPRALSSHMSIAKQIADVHTGMLSQLLCYRFLTEYDIGRQIEDARKIYRRKATLMLDELSKLPADKISFTRPQGGLFVWCTLPGLEDAGEFVMRLVREKKVAVVPGNGFFARQKLPKPHFRISFASPSDEQIVTAMRAIGELL